MFAKPRLDAANKKLFTPGVIVGIVLLFLIMGYGIVRVASARVHENVLQLLMPVEQACASEQGCPAVPQGWVELSQSDIQANAVARANLQDLPGSRGCASPVHESSYRTLIYCSTPEQFIVRWPYLKDALIIVSGGKERTMSLSDMDV